MGCDIHLYAEARGPGGWELCGAIFPQEGWYAGYHADALDHVLCKIRVETPRPPLVVLSTLVSDSPRYEPQAPSVEERWEADGHAARGLPHVGDPFGAAYGDESTDDDSCYVRFPSRTREPYHARDYTLFGILADVRGDGPPLAAPRGVPDDASAGYRAIVERWGADGHTHSWYSLSELLATDWDARGYPRRDPDAIGGGWCRALDLLQALGRDGDDVRIVFFFDN